MTRTELIQQIKDGKTFEFYCFWRGFLSQWHPSPFIVDGKKYLTAEHWMMAEKARTFNDTETLSKILKTIEPKDVKALGRNVKNYNDDKWANVRYESVVIGSFHKFNHNKDLRNMLLDTGNKVLVEASPKDTIWGIGLPEEHPDATKPERWKGKNLLGFALMEAREIFKNLADAEGDLCQQLSIYNAKLKQLGVD